MDNVCHTLVGAALGEAGLKRRTRFGSVTLMLSSNLPDVDVFVLPAASSFSTFPLALMANADVEAVGAQAPLFC